MYRRFCTGALYRSPVQWAKNMYIQFCTGGTSREILYRRPVQKACNMSYVHGKLCTYGSVQTCTGFLYRHPIQAVCTRPVQERSVQERSVQKRLYIAFVLKRLGIAFLKRFMFVFTYRVMSFEVRSAFIHRL